MKHWILHILVAICIAQVPIVAADAGGESAKAGAAGKPTALTGRLLQTRANIDRLFRHRDGQIPAPSSRQNPFRTGTEPTGTRPPGAGAAEVETQAGVDSDAKLLRDAIATLRIGGGTIEGRDGSRSILINDTPYRESQTIRTRVRDLALTLRIKQITSDTVTLALNNAEQTYRFRGAVADDPDTTSPSAK